MLDEIAEAIALALLIDEWALGDELWGLDW